MGGKPLMAIAILGWDKLAPEVAAQVMEGRKACADE
jgi:selenophosphate synthase